MFQGEPQATRTLADQQTLGQGFIDWLKSRFGWMFQANATTSIGTAYVYGDGEIPSWAILGDYDNGSAQGAGRSEYIWLPTPDGAIPVGMYRNGKFYAIHSDHLGTPRLMTNDLNKPVWQWPYSAFGAVEPTGILKATPKTPMAGTPQSVALKKTPPEHDLTLRYPGQMKDAESGTNQNWNREYDSKIGRYRQFDPIGLRGGINGYAYAGSNPLTFIDPMGLKHKANSEHCKALRRKIQNSQNEVDTRWKELDANTGQLPERIGTGEALSATRRGHRTLINKEDNVLRKWEKRYEEECEPEDKDQGGGSCDECSAGATAAATMVGGYLVYRCIRMLPSLLPPLWWTVPGNLAVP